MPQQQGRTSQRLFRAGLFLLLVLFNVIAASAFSTFDEANRLYEQGKYTEAASIYESILKSGRRSASIYFNLGNAYFKDGQLGRALFQYRMAESLAPRDADIQANLRFARERVPDTISIESPSLERVIRYFTINELAAAAAVLFWIWAVIFCLSCLRPKTAQRLRGIGLFVGTALAIAIIFLILNLWISRSQVAIVISAAPSPVNLGPLAESQPSFAAPDGSELEVLNRRAEWLQVRDRLNRSGWVHHTNISLFPPRR